MKADEIMTIIVKFLSGLLLFLFLSACSSTKHAQTPERGEVLLQFEISEKGVVENVVVLRAEPPGYFEEIAVDWARKAKFSPALKKGIPVRSKVKYLVNFDSTEIKPEAILLQE